MDKMTLLKSNTLLLIFLAILYFLLSENSPTPKPNATPTDKKKENVPADTSLKTRDPESSPLFQPSSPKEMPLAPLKEALQSTKRIPPPPFKRDALKNPIIFSSAEQAMDALFPTLKTESKKLWKEVQIKGSQGFFIGIPTFTPEQRKARLLLEDALALEINPIRDSPNISPQEKGKRYEEIQKKFFPQFVNLLTLDQQQEFAEIVYQNVIIPVFQMSEEQLKELGYIE